jgi:hypothetical protein
MSQQNEIIVGSGGSFENVLPDEGQYLAYCYAIIVIGTVPGYQDKMQEKLMFLFELPTTKHVFDESRGEEPFAFNKEFTRSLSKQANMRQFVNQWRGKPLTDAEAEAFNVVGLMDIPSIVNLYHSASKKDATKKYIDISSISPFRNPVGQSTSLPRRANEVVVFDWSQPFDPVKFLKIPLWIRNKMIKSSEFINLRINIPMLNDETWDSTNMKVVKKPKMQSPQQPNVQSAAPGQNFAAPPASMPSAGDAFAAPPPPGQNFVPPQQEQKGSEDAGFNTGFNIPS